MKQTDICILGGGITALSTAWTLSKEGKQVTICYTPRPHNATQAAGGMLSPSCEADGCDPALIELPVQSCATYPDWVSELERVSGIQCGYRTEGTLLVALHHDHNQELEHLVAFQQQFALSHQWCTRKQLKGLEPNLTRHIGGLHFANDYQIDPRQLYRALRTGLHKLGVTMLEGECRLEMANDQVEYLICEHNKIFAHTYILSDGAWSMEHLPTLPLRPVKGQYLLLAPKEGQETLVNHVIRTPDVYIIPREKGQLYIGATMEEESFDNRETVGATLDLLYHAFQVLPGVYEMVVVEHGKGFRPALRDNQPLIGPHYRSDGTSSNLWFNLGHYRHGIMLAPQAATLLKDALLYQHPIPMAFDQRRFVTS